MSNHHHGYGPIYFALIIGIAALVLGSFQSCELQPAPAPSPSTTIQPILEEEPAPSPSSGCGPAADGCNTTCCAGGTCASTTLMCAPAARPRPITAAEISYLAHESSCARVDWKDRSSAPKGFIGGMALAYARSYCRWISPGTTVAGITGKARGDSSHDWLTHYGLDPRDRLLTTWAFGIGLGMRESSGEYCEGRDMSATNAKHDTAEAGTFQQSFNSRGASSRLMDLYAWYKADPARCQLEYWKQGINPGSSDCTRPVAGDGPGREWQAFTRKCPAFGAEWAMALTRVLRKHFGPINRHDAELSTRCVTMLEQVKRAIDREPSACEGLL